MEDICVALVAVGSESQGIEIGKALIEERLAACVNLIKGVRSLYMWEGRLADDQEILMLIKTSRAVFPRLKARVLELHPYQVPEIIALPVLEGSPPYVKWVIDSTGP